MPDDYEELQLSCNFLPFCERSPAAPFSGFVLNFNVATAAHRDVGDKHFCAVFTFQQCVGGELGLYEPGIVLESRSGDLIIFQSCKVTHFNLHFQGIRASLVLHSDKTGDQWAENYNRWDGVVY